MITPANGLVIAACILILGCIGLSTVVSVLHIRAKREALVRPNNNLDKG